MLSRSAQLARPAQRILSRRTYATEASEPINKQRGNSKTPFFIAAAVATLGLGYTTGIFGTPATPGVKGIQEATHPKTPGARAAAGAPEKALDQPAQVGGDQKAKK